MLNAYISKEKILEALSNLEDIEGYINKRDLQQAILGIKEYRKPKRQKNNISLNNRNKRTAYNVTDIISNIIKYQNDVKFGVRESFLSLHLHKCFHFRERQKCRIEVFSGQVPYFGNINPYTGGAQELKDESIIVFSKDLEKILGVSKPTVARLKRMDIVKKKEKKARIYIDGEYIEYERRYGWFSYYDLEEIRRNLNCLK